MRVSGANWPRTAESKGIELVGYHDLDGDPGFKLAMQRVDGRYYLYTGHLWRERWGVLDVTDPAAPELVGGVDGPPNTWTIQVQVADGLMIGALERPSPGWGYDPELTEQTGVLLWDVATDPRRPRLLSHYDTTGRGTHRNYYAGGQYAYLAAEPEGFMGNILSIVDVSDPTAVTEVGRWWWPGQHVAEGETAEFGRFYLHGPAYVVGDLAYLSYGKVGLVILDISDKTAPKLLSRLSFGDFGSVLGCHSAIPYGDVLIANSEMVTEDGENLPYTVAVDIKDPTAPRILSFFPAPVPEPQTGYRNYYEKGTRFSAHNQHQWQEQDCLLHDDSRVYLSYFNAGLRVYDISDPLSPHEIAYYVPEDPTVRRGVKPINALRTSFEDVIVDDRGYIYCTDKNYGIFVLRLTA